jgi:hypothetical protein
MIFGLSLLPTRSKKDYMFKSSTIVLSLFGALLTAALFLGNAGGAALVQKTDRTGSPLSPGPCQACHSQGIFNPSLDVSLLAAGQPVTSYIPGEVYTFRVIVNANPNASLFGFQAVALLPNGDVQAGTFQGAPSGMGIRTVNDRKYPEHSFPSLKDTFSLQWVAPAANSGEVRFYASGVAANGNSDSSGDGSATKTLFITESGPSSLPENSSEQKELNTVQYNNQLHINCPKTDGNLILVDLNGRMIIQQPAPAGQQIVVPTKTLIPGIYIVHWTNGQRILSQKILIQ